MARTICCIALIFIVASVVSVRQEFKFYDRFRHLAEDSITLTRHYPNVTGTWDFFLKSARGRCVEGEWATYLEENYRNIYYKISSCSDHTEGYFKDVKSLRYLGASETTTRAISFYEDILYQGEEYFAAVPASATGPSFPVHSIAATGLSNWSLFEGPDFTGRSVCLESSTQVHLISRSAQDLGITNIGSFIRSCDAAVVSSYTNLRK